VGVGLIFNIDKHRSPIRQKLYLPTTPHRINRGHLYHNFFFPPHQPHICTQNTVSYVTKSVYKIPLTVPHLTKHKLLTNTGKSFLLNSLEFSLITKRFMKQQTKHWEKKRLIKEGKQFFGMRK